MILSILDWKFEVDTDATWQRTIQNSQDHCTCAYCQNFYEAVPAAYPDLPPFLEKWGIHFQGPSELMPFEPTLMLACYRVQGKILEWGREQMHANGVLIAPEAADDDSFFLWIGELSIPWLRTEPMEDVISPANLPEFLERMEAVWLLRHGNSLFFS